MNQQRKIRTPFLRGRRVHDDEVNEAVDGLEKEGYYVSAIDTDTEPSKPGEPFSYVTTIVYRKIR